MKEGMTAAQTKAAMKGWFQATSTKWELRIEHVKMFDAVLSNCLAGEQALTREHFRQKYRSKQSELDWLEGRSFIKQEQQSTSAIYRLQFLGFAILLCAGSAKADALRVLMDKVLKAVKKILDDPKLTRLTALSLDNIAAGVGRSAQDAELVVALRILSTGSVGINLNQPPDGDATVNFSDHVYHTDNMLAYALHFVQGYGHQSTGNF